MSRVERVQHVGEGDRIRGYLEVVGLVELQVALRVRKLVTPP